MCDKASLLILMLSHLGRFFSLRYFLLKYVISLKKSKILTSVKILPISLQKEKSSCKFVELKKYEHAK